VAPALSLINIEHSEEGWKEDRWGLARVLPYEAQSASEVKTLVCIRQSRVAVGRYTDWSSAYMFQWEVRLVSWPDGTVLGAETLSGSSPPKTKYGSGDESGITPGRALWEWLIPILDDKTILLAGGAVKSIAFSPDGKTLAAGTAQRTVKLWDVAIGQEVCTLSGHGLEVWGVAFSPDGKTLASGSLDHTVKLWDAATGQEVRTLSGHTHFVYSVAFSPDGKTLASGSRDGMIKLWDVATGP